MSTLIRSRFRATAGFTLSEVLIAAFVGTVVVTAMVSLTLAALRTYYVDSDYLEIGGQTRRLTDTLIEKGTLADELIVFYDRSDLRPAARGDRGDCLMLFKRDRASPASQTPPWGFIPEFDCFYLAFTSGGAGPVSLWHIKGTAVTGSETTDPAAALAAYTLTTPRRVSANIFSGGFPRATPATFSPASPREGVFTNDGSRSPNSPTTVLVNLPASLPARGTGTAHTARSNLTFSLSPRS